MKKRFPFLLIILLLISLTACGSDSSGKVISYDIPAPVKNLDPQFATNKTARMIISNTFDGLFRQLPTGEIENRIAQSYDVSNDQLTYTFHLRKDAVWSNDDPITAHDFAFALRRMFDSTAFSPFASQFSAIQNADRILADQADNRTLGVSTPDNYTLKIQLERPDNLLPERLTSSYAMPCNEKFFKSTSARYGLTLKNLIFNGPFYVRLWGSNGIVSLRRNSTYVDAETVIAGGANLIVPTAEKDEEEPLDSVTRFLNGETDACKIDFETLPSVLEQKGSYASFEDTVWVLLFNCENDYLSNPDIRRALSYTVDRSLFDAYIPGNLHATSMLIPPAVTLSGGSYREKAGTVSPIVCNHEISKQYYETGLNALGISQLPFKELLVCEENHVPLLTGFIQQSWQKQLGLYTGITKLSQEDLISRINSGNFEAAVLPLSASYSSPESILSMFQSNSAQNYAAYHSDRFDTLMQSIPTMKSNEQSTAYMQAEQQLLEECVVIPMFFETTYYGLAKGVSDLEFSPFLPEIYFKYARKE